jgi:predicted TIM-barrel fold metal-dependent hydrolase
MLTRRRALTLGASLVVLALLVLVAVPPARALLDWVMMKVVAHRVLTLPLAALGGLFLIALWRKRFAWAALLLVGALGATGVYGLTRLNARYPANILTEPSTVGKVWRLLMGRDILLTDYDPRPTLKVEREPVERALVPAIDIHFHLGSLENVTPEQLVSAMDAAGIQSVVNLDGNPGAFDRFTREFRDRYPDRFIQFTQLDFPSVDDLPAEQVSWIRLTAGMGARGIKIHKYLGLGFRDSKGDLVPIDDPRLDSIWSTAGELGLPVLIHTADPTPFWQPTDRYNERYEELLEFPDWSYYYGAPVWNRELGRMELSPYPGKAELLQQRLNVVARHPETTFIGAHMGGSPEDLAALAAQLDAYPNYYVDMASRVPELGRQPYAARQFFIDYQDRILFGSDGGYALGTTDWNAERFFRANLEFLQTANEYIEYPLWGINRQGRWRVYGLDLPDDVLRKVLHDNAARLLGLPPSTAP